MQAQVTGEGSSGRDSMKACVSGRANGNETMQRVQLCSRKEWMECHDSEKSTTD